MILLIVLISVWPQFKPDIEPSQKSKQTRKSLAGMPWQQSEVINTKFASQSVLKNEIWRKSCSFWSTKYVSQTCHKNQIGKNQRKDFTIERESFQLKKLWKSRQIETVQCVIKWRSNLETDFSLNSRILMYKFLT